MVNTESDISFRQGGLRVDLRTRTLTLAGRAVKLGGRAFDVLHALVEQRDRVVAKQQLLEVVWPGLVVEENNLQVHVAALRKVLGSDAIVTVSGRGYRFTLVADPQTDDSVRRSTPVFETRQPPFAATTTLIGRDALVASACALLHQPDVRLVSMTGTGGSGKTRVGLRVSAEVAAAFQDGSYTVMLAPVRDAALVASAIATVLSIQETGSQPLADLLVGYLREREVLLTLDSFEHVLAATPLVATLLASCPRLKVLVTSRALLKLPGEHDVLVPALALPSRHATASDVPLSPAVQLLCERARAAGRVVGESAGEMAVVAEICRTLDGLPLALELAAARLRMLSPQALLNRLGSRMTLLHGTDEQLPLRQRTLRATMAWSHDLLPMQERRLFRRLAVFVGGWDLESAEAVTDLGDLSDGVLDLLTALVDHSLAQRIDDVDGDSRFAMLETVREYAHQQLEASGETQLLRQRHAEHYTARAESAEPALTSAQRQPWIGRLQADYQNLRAALTWLIRERADAELGLRLAAALPWLWYFANLYNEGYQWLREALALPGAEQHVVPCARGLCGAARLATFINDMPQALALATRSVELWRGTGDRRGLGLALFHMGVPAFFIHGREQALAALDESLACFREIPDAWGVALATTYKGVVLAFRPGAEGQAQPLLTEGRARFIALDDDWGASTAPGYLSAIAMREGKLDLARQITDGALQQLIELGDTYRIARGHHQMAEISMAQGQLHEAMRHVCASLAINREQNRWGDAVQQLRLMARLHWLLHSPEQAVRLFATALRTDAPRAALPPDDPRANQEALAGARAAIGEPMFEAEWALGSVMPFDQAVALAIAGARTLPAS